MRRNDDKWNEKKEGKTVKLKKGKGKKKERGLGKEPECSMPPQLKTPLTTTPRTRSPKHGSHYYRPKHLDTTTCWSLTYQPTNRDDVMWRNSRPYLLALSHIFFFMNKKTPNHVIPASASRTCLGSEGTGTIPTI